METKIPAATWMVRSFTPQKKDETFTEVDPRKSRIVGYHKYQDEKRPGAHLDQPQGLDIARRSFPNFGVDYSQLDLKEALSFQQPNRRDWLFHFQERAPLTAEAFRRVSVRVAGDQVTQFTSTIKIPDQAYRDASKTTLLNIVLVVLRIVGGLALLSLTVAGFVVAARKHFPWRRPARLTAMLAIVPIISAIFRWKTSLFGYDTSVGWDTFVNGLVITTVTVTGVQIGLLFLAFAAIEAAYPQAIDWFRHEGRARFGRSALIAAITATGLLAIRKILLQLLAQAFPSLGSIDGIDIPLAVNMTLPVVVDVGQAVVRAIEASAVVGLFAVSLREMPKAKKFADITAILALFFITLEPNANAAEAPLMLLSAVTSALAVWFVVRFILRENLLAYPLAATLALLLGSAASLLQNQRNDLILQGVVEIIAAIALMIWIAYPKYSEPQHV
jgi:hypothetical protein